MKEISTELKVGVFALLVIIVLTYMTFKVGRLPFIWEKGYRLYAEFEDVVGLDERSRIKIAGVDAGIVDQIDIHEGKARLSFLLNPDIKIYKNAKVALKMTGLLGDRYISISTGTPDEPLLRSGDTITNVVQSADVDTLLNELTSAAAYVSDLAKNLQDVFGDPEKKALSGAIHNLRAMTENLRDISEENRVPLRTVIAQLEKFTKELSEKGPTLVDDMSRAAKSFGEKGPKMMDDLSVLAQDLKEVIEENRYSLKESIDNIKTVSKSASTIAQKIESGEGTIGKLVKDGKLYDSLSKVSEQAEKSLDVVGRLRTFLDFHTEYNTGEGEWKGYFDLTLQPKEDKYYILGVISDPKGSVRETDRVINGVRTTEEETESKVEFSAQFAKRFDDLALRIGLMENTFGLGADYFFHNDKGKVKLDMWDFSAKEAEADRSHARVGVDYRIFKYIFVSSGIDNLLNSNRRGIYVGGGFRFEDEDFKYLFGKPGSLPLP
ncbi:MAG: MCE family protein [Nitrospiraceae bacterium]|nr:MAG: MCE family protein [Nitrospiraceae bacterium]